MITPDGRVPRRIFPCRPGTKGVPIGPPYNERGRGIWKPFQTRDPTADEIRAWARIPHDVNWALVLGQASGLVVIDVDPRHGGSETIKKYPMPQTLVIRTPGGGRHYYFACPPGGLRSQVPFDQGIEVRADGALVLVPPSWKFLDHQRRYYEVVPDTATKLPAPLPAWAQASSSTSNWPASPTWQTALGTVPPGQQDTCLISLAGRLAYELSEPLWATIPGILREAAQKYPQEPHRPFTDSDFQRLAQSACQMERDRRTTRSTVSPVTL